MITRVTNSICKNEILTKRYLQLFDLHAVYLKQKKMFCALSIYETSQ